MHNIQRRLFVVFLFATLGVALIASWSCSKDDPEPETVTPATIQALLVNKLDNIEPLGDALQRTVTHLSGTPQPGVNLVVTGTGASGTVGVDLDGDGTQESTVTGTLTWNDPNAGFAGGAVLEITELTGNTVHLTSNITPVSATQVVFDDIEATVPVEGSRPRVVVSDGQITVDGSISPPSLSGFVNFVVGDLPATMTITTNGGQLSIFVQGSDFDFTVP